MGLVPKGVKDEAWKQLTPQHDYAVLSNPGESVYLKFGQGRGLYVSIDSSQGGRLVNTVDFESGELSLLGKIDPDATCILGRVNEANIKVMHAMISRQHLELTLTGNVLLIKDLGSTNGTFLLDENPHFDVMEYLDQHPLKSSETDTLDWVHEAFGVGINDFLKKYSQSKKETN